MLIGLREMSLEFTLRAVVFLVFAEFDGIRRGPPKSEPVAGDFYLASDAKVSYIGSNGLDHRNLRLKLHQNTEFDGIRRGPPKSESSISTPIWLLTPKYRM